MRKVVVNQNFKDRETGVIHKQGTIEELSEARIDEIKAVNPKLITVVGEKQPEADTASDKLKKEVETAKAEAEAAKAELEATKGEVEKLTQELADANNVIEELRKELAEAEKALDAVKKKTSNK